MDIAERGAQLVTVLVSYRLTSLNTTAGTPQASFTEGPHSRRGRVQRHSSAIGCRKNGIEGSMTLKNLRMQGTSFFFPVIFGFTLLSISAQGQEQLGQLSTPDTTQANPMLLASTASAEEFFKPAESSAAVSSSADELPDAPSAIASRESALETSHGPAARAHIAPALMKKPTAAPPIEPPKVAAVSWKFLLLCG